MESYRYKSGGMVLRRLYKSNATKVQQQIFAFSTTDKHAYLRSWLGSDIKPTNTEVPLNKSPLPPGGRCLTPKVAKTQKHAPSTSSTATIHTRVAVTSIKVDWSIPQHLFLRDIADVPQSSTCFVSLASAPKHLTADRISDLAKKLEAKGYSVIVSDVPKAIMGDLLESGIACIQNSVLGESIKSRAPDETLRNAATEQTQHGPSSLVHVGAVRSGQQIYAQGKSLVVIGSVNSGAEVMADGDVYVFGRLMGRAIAGIGEEHGVTRTSPSGCSIYCTNFAASLVGIQNVFVAPDEHDTSRSFIGKAVRISLSGFTKVNSTNSSSMIVFPSSDSTVGMLFSPIT